MNVVEAWFKQTVGKPFAFQREAWAAQAAGRSGLIHAPTGMGKTYAAWLGVLMRWAAQHAPKKLSASPLKTEPLRVLWITPLRALAADTEGSLRKPVADLNLPWTVERRTGDVSAATKARQKNRLPSALVTTPESLSLLLSYPDAQEKFASLELVVVDEWHELMSSKRGTQTELGLARLRGWNPALQTWGLSATLGNLDEAMDTLLGPPGTPAPAPGSETSARGSSSSGGLMIHAPDHKEIRVTTLLPPEVERFPWSGHLGLRMLPQVLELLEDGASTLLFTNTRSQAEIWFNAISSARPQWLGEVALHHGSIDRQTRGAVEDLLRAGKVRCCVCTSSLDLGVDFTPVERVIQVASPKGVARMLQRAGRSGHQPGKVSHLIGVPTNALELIDFAAARDAAARRDIESRRPLDRPLDVLVQHLVTCALGGGFVEAAMLAEVRQTRAFCALTDEQWGWCLDFVRRGGETLKVYPQYARVAEVDGRYVVTNPKIARLHRMSIGTITASASISVRMGNRTLGTVEESFVGWLKPGDKFVFAGYLLELVRVRAMVATCRRAKGTKAQVPRWGGGRSPLSTQLAAAVRARLDDVRKHGLQRSSKPSEKKSKTASNAMPLPPEMQAIVPLLELQQRWSVIPAADELLIEAVYTRDGFHYFLFPLRGRLVHEGLGTLLAHRLTAALPLTVTVTVNDYGIELLCDQPLELDDAGWRALMHEDGLLDDLLAALNTSQLARRAFRDITRIAGLIQTGFPGQSIPNRHLQASSELFFDVFTEFDPQNLLLDQARREVLDRQLEVTRLRDALQELSQMKLMLQEPDRLTPLAFPLWADRLREQHMTGQSWEERVSKMVLRLEDAAGEVRP